MAQKALKPQNIKVFVELLVVITLSKSQVIKYSGLV
jgi:hypothetical protein